MKKRNWIALGAIAAAGALVLSGCTSSSTSSETPEVAKSSEVTIAQNAALTSLNSNTALNYATYNSNITYMFQSTFNYYDNTPKLVKNEKFGTYEKLSDDPLTIKYTINKDVKWTDGTPVNASDLLLTWASSLSKYNDEKAVNFGSILAGSGLDLVTKTPEISDDGQSLTLVYDKPFVDWETVGFNPGISAAVDWEVAGLGSETGTDAQAAVVKAIQDDDTEKLTKLADTWRTGFDTTDLPANKALLVSDGPYTVTNLVKDDYVTLEKNKDYTWGPEPVSDKITVRFIPDQTAQVQALQNGEVNILYGQATADTVKALAAVKNVQSTTSPEAAYEHVDLTLNNKGPFDPETYGGDADKALKVRQAFFQMLPRQDMLDRLITPLSDTATLDNSSLFIPGSEGYQDDLYADYPKADPAKALALLKEAGVTTPIDVRFAYASDNPRRAGEFQLIQQAGKDAGFNVTDVGKPAAEFFGASGVGSGKYDYDASVFAYVLSALGVTGSEANTTSGNAYNYNGYANKDVDKLWKEAETAATYSDAVPLMQQIDKHLIDDAATMTLFQLPDVSAWSDSVKNVKNAPLTPNIFWNFWEWDNSK